MVCSSKMCSCWTLDNERFSSDKIIAAEGDLNKILAAEMKARYLAVSSHLQGYCLRVVEALSGLLLKNVQLLDVGQ